MTRTHQERDGEASLALSLLSSLLLLLASDPAPTASSRAALSMPARSHPVDDLRSRITRALSASASNASSLQAGVGARGRVRRPDARMTYAEWTPHTR